ncbi:MAG: ABC transporter substrate-binding protein [Pseudomonadota bacterium]
MRRSFLGKCLLLTAILAMVGFMTQINCPTLADAKEVFKIGCPATLSGVGASYGEQTKRTLEMMVPEINKRGGVLGRQIELIIEDDKGEPATAVRKARAMVEKDKVNVLHSPTYSSSALAVSAMLPTWKVIDVSSINGAGSLTGSKFNKYFFRPNFSAPMEAKMISAFMKDSPYKSFFGIGSDYVWGRSSVGMFKGSIEKMGKKWVGDVYPPIGNVDWATYIAKIKEAKPDVVYTAIASKDAVTFYNQAQEFGLTKETQFVLAILNVAEFRATGNAMEGFIGCPRYPFTYDSPKNKAFVDMYLKTYKLYPDMFDGECYDAINFMIAAIEKAKSFDADAIIKAWEGMEFEGIQGKFVMRACDHQAVRQGFMGKAVKAEGYPHLIPKLLKIYPGEEVVPPCRKDTYED